MKRFAIGFVIFISGLFVIGLSVLLLSKEGIDLCIMAADRILPGQLSVKTVKGRLISQFSLQEVRYSDGSNDYALEDLSISWHPRALLHKELEIRSLAIKGFSLISEPTSEDADIAVPDKVTSLPPVTLPLTLTIQKAVIDSLVVKADKDAPGTRLNSIAIEDLSGHEQLVRFGNFTVTSDLFSITAQGHLQTGDVYLTQMDITYSFKSEDLPTVTGNGFLDGSLDELKYESHFQSPFPGTLKGVVHDLTGKTEWLGVFTADRIAVPELNKDWPAVTLTGAEFSGKGNREMYSLQVKTEATYDSFKNIIFSAQADGDINGLKVKDFRLVDKESELTGHGHVSWGDVLSWQVQISGSQLNPGFIDERWPGRLHLEASSSGQQKNGAIHAAVDLQSLDGQLRDIPFKARSKIQINGEDLAVDELNVRLFDEESELTGHGHVSWGDVLSWQVQIAGNQLNPGFIDERWPGRLHLEASSSGQQKNGKIHAAVDLQSLDGQLRDIPFKARGKIQINGEDLAVDEFFLQSSDSIVQISGHLAENFDLEFKLNSPDLDAMWPELSGVIDVAGRVSGTRAKPHLQFDLTGNEIAMGDSYVRDIISSGSGFLTPEGEVKASLLASGLSVGETSIDTVAVDLHGMLQDHLLDARLNTSDVNFIFKVEGGYDKKVWKGNVRNGEIHTDQLSDWQLQNPVPLYLSPNKVDIGRFCLAETGSAIVCVDGNFETDGLWSARAEIKTFPVDLFDSMQEKFREMEGVVNGTATLQGSGSVMGEIRMDLSTDDLSLHLDLNEDQSRNIEWRKNTIKFLYHENRAEITINSILKDGSTILTEAILKDIDMLPFSIEKTGVQGNIQFDMRDLQFLSALSFPAVEPYGSLSGIMDISGTLKQPEFLGTVQLKQGKMIVPALGITIMDVKAKVDGKDGRLRLNITASSGEGTLQANGVYSFSSEDDNPVDFNLLGDNFELVNLPEAKIRISPELAIKMYREKGELRGNVLISEAYISPYNMRGKIQPSKDIVLIDDEAKKKKPDQPLFTNVTITTGKKVFVNAFGLKGRLEGQLRVIDSPGKTTTGKGALDVREGTFSIYGRQLKIVKGQLLYSDSPMDNPGIDIRAENTAGGVTTGIAVSGFLQEPEINFYSSPVMDQDEIIKRLLMNTTLVGSSEEEGFVGSVAADTGLDPISSVVQDVKESLRVDDIKIETGKESDDLSLVVGTWLSPKLYISYGKNLLKESGSFNTRYVLGHGFSLETESGATQNGFDLKYEIDR